MVATRLYKYLDFDGGLKMLEHHNLQFTNATKFNDPFDCDPNLYDYSNVPENQRRWPGISFVSMMKANEMRELREHTWICCLSEVPDALLMWAYYNNHKGICIGLNKEAVLESCNYKFFGTYPPFAKKVNYKDILPKPDFFKEHPSWFEFLTTKSKEWEHEQEVRLITKDPAWVRSSWGIPSEFDGEEGVDGKEMRYYPVLTADCFESVYLGVNMLPRNKEIIIETARKLNPSIKIYQMTINPETLRLKEELITQ